MQTMIIELGNGVKLQAPIKLDMTLEEWFRMTNYINCILNLNEIQIYPKRIHQKTIEVKNFQ